MDTRPLELLPCQCCGNVGLFAEEMCIGCYSRFYDLDARRRSHRRLVASDLGAHGVGGEVEDGEPSFDTRRCTCSRCNAARSADHLRDAATPWEEHTVLDLLPSVVSAEVPIEEHHALVGDRSFGSETLGSGAQSMRRSA